MEMSDSIKNDEERMILIKIEGHLEPEPAPECCIYRVSQSLRTVNEKAYTPQLISIGPLHHGKEELADMEKRKPAYVQSFLRRIPTQKQAEILTFINNKERDIRNCYAETSELESHQFVKMILYDAIFIIELFIRSYLKESDFFLNKPAMEGDLTLDMLLLENQLPYFVLDKLYNLASAGLDIIDNPTFMDLCHEFLGDFCFESFPSSQVRVKHFTDLGRSALLGSCQSKVKSNKRLEDFSCAVKLHESGVKFKPVKSDCLFDITLRKRKQLGIPRFEVPELQMPHLDIGDETEVILRNIMALEQYHYPEDNWVCQYIDLMDLLIDNEKDVDFLVGQGIISNNLGDNASVASMFNKLNQQVYIGESCYDNICQELKTHYDNPWNHTKAKLRSVYFSNLWRGTATVAAVILVLLTVIQTICSVIQLI